MSFLYYLLNTSIPDRPAQWTESLELIGAGWGSIFIVTLIAMTCIFALNKLFPQQK